MYRLYGYRSNRYPSLEKLVELLVSKGTDVNAQAGYYGNALQAVLIRGSRGHDRIAELCTGRLRIPALSFPGESGYCSLLH